MKPIGNGIVEFVDDKPDKNSGFFCMDLVLHMWNDEEVVGYDAWHERFNQAKAGQCPYRDRCPRHERTMKKIGKQPVQLNLF